MPRSKATIITALADRYPRDNVRRTLMRLGVIERLIEKDGRCTVPPDGGTDQG